MIPYVAVVTLHFQKKKLKDKKAIINITNEDEKCLFWCLVAHRMDIAQNPERVTNYIAYEHSLNMEGVTYPVPLSQISRVEALNNLRINVFGYENDQITILRVSDKEDLPAINLMLLADEEKQHYCLIKNFSRLMNKLHITELNIIAIGVCMPLSVKTYWKNTHPTVRHMLHNQFRCLTNTTTY